MLRPPPEFLREAEALEIHFDPGDLERLGEYLARLLEANTRMNLTAITDPREAWVKHVFDSLTLLPVIGSAAAKRVIDVGSGGGLPGLPLAITMPAVAFTLLDATAKKTRFLCGVIEALGLSNALVVNERAETIGRDPEHRERYDVAVARAVGRLAVLVELAAPLIRVGGHIVATKGRRAGEEIEQAKRALRLLHCRVAVSARTPTGTTVVLEKLRPTPKRYPRRPGEPRRAPL